MRGRVVDFCSWTFVNDADATEREHQHSNLRISAVSLTTVRQKTRFKNFTAAHLVKKLPSDHAKPLLQTNLVFTIALRTHDVRLIVF